MEELLSRPRSRDMSLSLAYSGRDLSTSSHSRLEEDRVRYFVLVALLGRPVRQPLSPQSQRRHWQLAKQQPSRQQQPSEVLTWVTRVCA